MLFRSLYGPGTAATVLAVVRLAVLSDQFQGLPVLRRFDPLDFEIEIAWQDDWHSAPPLSLGGGGDATNYLCPEDKLLGTAESRSSFPIALVTKAVASSHHLPSQAGPVLDAMDANMHIPFALSKLGESAAVTPEPERAEALKWAHA